jgi:hypothetical protein
MTRDLRTESHLRAVAVWYRLCGIVVTAFVTFVIWMLGDFGLVESLRDGYWNVAFVTIVLWMGAGSYLLGEFLARYHAWARITIVVLSMASTAFQVFLFVMGFFRPDALVLPLLSLGWTLALAWLLLGRRARAVTTREYRQLVAFTPSEKPSVWRTPFLVLPFVLAVASALFVVFAGVLRRHVL